MAQTKMGEYPPFFIVGCGRSGTTLLRAILNNHPEVGIPLESLFIVDYLRSEKPLAVLRQCLLTEYEVREWGLTPSEDDFIGCRSAVELISRLHQLFLRKHGKHRWGQKTPRFVHFYCLLRRSFPSARFIHIIRDPRAVVSSLMSSEVHRSSCYHAAVRWRDDVRAALELERTSVSDTLRLHYEALVSDPEHALRRVCRFLGLEFVPTMFDYPQNTPQEYGRYYERIHAGLSRPVSITPMGKWREKLSSADIGLIEELVAPEMKEVGYLPETNKTDRPGRAYQVYSRLSRYAGIPGQLWHYHTHRGGYLRSVLTRKLRLGTFDYLPVNR